MIGLGDAALEIVRESVERALPKPPVGGDPSVDLLHGFGFKRQDMIASVPAPLEQSGPLENAQVLCYRGPGNPQRPRQLTRSRFG